MLLNSKRHIDRHEAGVNMVKFTVQINTMYNETDVNNCFIIF